MLSKLIQIFKQISNIGKQFITDEQDLIALRIVNSLTLFLICVNAFFSFFASKSPYDLLKVVNYSSLVLTFLPIIFTFRGKFELAKHSLLLVTGFSVFALTVIFGTDTYLQNSYLPLSLLPLLLFNSFTTFKKYLILFILLFFSLLFLSQMCEPIIDNTDTNLAFALSRKYHYIINTIMIFTATFLMVYLFKKESSGLLNKLSKREDELKSKNKELEESKALFNAVSEYFPNGSVIIINRNFNLTFGDGMALREKMGNEFTSDGKSLVDIIGNENFERDEYFLKLGFEGSQFSYENKINDDYFINSITPIFKDSKGISHILIVSQKINELKEAQFVANKKEKMISTIVNSAPTAIVLYDMQKRFVMANDFYCDFSGISESSLIGKTFHEVFGTNVNDMFDKYLDKSILGESGNCTLKVGSEENKRHLYVIYLPYIDTNNVQTGVLVIGLDITEQIQKEELLKLNEFKLRTALKASKQINWELDVETMIITFDGELGEFVTGRAFNGGLTLQQFSSMVSPLYRDLAASSMTTQLEDVNYGKFLDEYPISFVEGNERWYSNTGETYEEFPNGFPKKIVGILSDIHDKKIAEETIKDKNRQITDSINYAAGIQRGVLNRSLRYINDNPNAMAWLMPRDTLSGDFYFAASNEDLEIYVVADATGHGVPAALMTIMGNDFFADAVFEKKLRKANEILLEVDKKITELLISGNQEKVNDGMDAGVLVIDRVAGIAEFAGAKMPLFIAHDGEVIKIKGSRSPIGSSQYANKFFENSTIELKDNFAFFMSSDGFQDQFGNGNHKKYGCAKFKNLLGTISNLPIDQWTEKFETEFENWKQDEDQLDDVIILGVKI